MMGNLFPHQVEDAALLLETPHLPNFSEPGTGKTRTTIEAIRLASLKSGLVVAPVIALHMWKAELETHLGVSVKILKGGGASLLSPSGGYYDFYVTSYGTIINSKLKSWFMEQRGGALVLDESHALKTPTSKRTIAIYGKAGDGKGGLFSAFERTFPMTGTPIVRHNDDMYSQLWAGFGNVLKEDGIRNRSDFLQKFCFVQVKKFHPRMQPKLTVVASKNSDELHDLVFNKLGAIRRVMGDVKVTMPPITYRELVVPIRRSTAISAILHGMSDAQIERALVAEESGMSKAVRMLGVLKAEGVAEYVIESANSGPVVVGYMHTSVGEAIVTDCYSADLSVARISGSTSMDDREAYRVMFNAGEIDVLVCQMVAAGTAMNLQERGRHVVIAEDNFSPSIVEQFIKRVYRIGQKNHVQVDFVHAEHVIDDAIVRVRERKSASNKIVMGD